MRSDIFAEAWVTISRLLVKRERLIIMKNHAYILYMTCLFIEYVHAKDKPDKEKTNIKVDSDK